ncbi:MAG: filamentous hemagglutinin N-terminal domain-containing protein, partial [Leptolyngbyaceae cyanobacterium bins.59]|nr:filamentous hemagglutinin N-terminal domain-containing protein [Leptolyngbyaceae cyanobacterium bins.59]
MQGTKLLVGALCFSAFQSCLSHSALAQIQPDRTLGSESSVVAPESINGFPLEVIHGGALRGANLFHSFLEFNVLEGQTAYFANPVGVSQILTRVTGSNPSQILGKLGVDGPANLFLINPNGILFGANASLDIRGSLVVSSANSLLFPDGTVFSATTPQPPPLFKSNVRPGLQYGSGLSAPVTNAGTLQVGQDLVLSGGSVTSSGSLQAPQGRIEVESRSGDINIRSLTAQTATLSAANNLNLIESQIQTIKDLILQAGNTVKIRDSVNAPFWAVAGGQLLVQGNNQVDIFALAHPNSGFRANEDLILRSPEAVLGDTRYWTGGNFRIEQLNHQPGNLISPADPIIYASGDVTFGAYWGASLHVLAGGSVTIPNGVLITASDLQSDTINPTNTPTLANVQLSSGQVITIDGSRSPTLDIRSGVDPNVIGAPGIVDFGGPPSLFPVGTLPLPLNQPATSSDITIGSIIITAPNGTVLLTNHYAPNLALPGGNITVNSASVFGVQGVQTSPVTNGPSGNVTMDARNQLILNTPINTSSNTSNAGNVTLLAKNQITINQRINTDTRGPQNAGNISLSAPTITIQNGASLSANTFGEGRGGTIAVTNTNQLTLNNGQISTLTGDDTRNNPLAATNGGQGGNILLNVRDGVTLTNQSVITTQSNQLSSGRAGDLTIATGQLNLDDGSFIAAVTQGTGAGGNINLQIGRELNLTGTSTRNTQTGIFLNAFGLGNAGELIVQPRQNPGPARIIIRDGAQISGNASAQGRAANLTFDVPSAAMEVIGASNVNPSSVLSATRGPGNGGTIRFNVQSLSVQNGGQVDAQTIGTGQAGQLSVIAPNVLVSGRTGAFRSRLFLDSSGTGDAGELQIQTQSLSIRNDGEISARTRDTGRGGIIDVNASRSIEINNGRLLFDSSGSGDPRGIRVLTGQMLVENSGQVTVSSTQSARAGDLEVTASSVTLNNQSNFTAETQTGTGGNIRLQNLETLSLGNNSRISTATVDGQGGSVNVQATRSVNLNQGS